MQNAIKFLSSRWLNFAAIPAVILVWFLATDPSHGADTMLRLQLWAQALLVTGLAYAISKAMLGSASSEKLYEACLTRGNLGAGMAYMGICVLRATVLLALLVFFSQVQR